MPQEATTTADMSLPIDATILSIRTATKTVAPTETLCSRCAAIDIEAAFTNFAFHDHREPIADLEHTIQEMRESDCPLCNLFAAMCPSDSDDSDSNPFRLYHLRVFSAKRLFAPITKRIREPWKFQTPDAAMLGVVRGGRMPVKCGAGNNGNSHVESGSSLKETGCLGIRSTDPFGIQKLSPSVWDVQFGKQSLQYCMKNHIVACIPRSVPRHTDNMRNFRVIDCQWQQIIFAPRECQYVALSYVWGLSKASSPSHSQRTESSRGIDAPKLIQDSIEVTLQLGFRYLWIDRYCINQKDEHDKLAQVRQMDLIYAGAQLTIIAAAGSDPHHGLPGVGGTLRKQQPTMTISGRSICSTLPHAQYSINNSVWATRGWTFQEGLLSKRRIIFTNEQVFFECNGMHCAEALILPLEQMSTAHNRRFKTSVPNGAFTEKNPGKQPWDIMSYISTFSRRELTFPEDTLNAMQGIFHAFETGRKPVYQFLGIPITSTISDPRNGIRISRLKKRSPEQSFLVGLFWYHDIPGKRNPHFSSWTWAGWSGPVGNELLFPLSSSEWTTNSDQAYLLIEEPNGTHGSKSSFPATFESMPDFLLRRRPTTLFLKIQTWTFSCSIVHHIDPKDELMTLRLPLLQGPQLLMMPMPPSTGIYIQPNTKDKQLLTVKAYFDTDSVSGNSLTGLLMGDLEGTGSQTNVLLVEEKEGYAERVGIFSLNDFECYRWIETGPGAQTWDKKVVKFPSENGWLKDLPKERRVIRLG